MNQIDNVKRKIEGKGYFEIIFVPSNGHSEKFKFQEISRILDQNIVRLRGWSYPMIPPYDRAEGEVFKRPFNIGNGMAFYSDFDDRKEIGALFQSGQFVSKVSIIEDYIKEFNGKRIENKYSDFLAVIYKITEIVLFIKNYVESTDISGGDLRIIFHDTENRILDSYFSPMIFDFGYGYKSALKEIETSLSFKREDIISDHKKLSRKIIIDIFNRFNWLNVSESMIETHQANLITGRI